MATLPDTSAPVFLAAGPTGRRAAAPPDLAVVAPRRRVPRELAHRCAIVSADLVASLVASFGALAATRAELAAVALLVAPLLVLCAKLTGLYDRDELLLRRSTLTEVPRLFQLATLVTCVVAVAGPIVAERTFAASHVAVLWGLLVVGLVAARLVARRIARVATLPERCLVVADEGVAGRLGERLADERGVQLVGRLAPAAVTADYTCLLRTAERLGAERLVVAADPGASRQGTMDLVRAAKGTGLRISVIPDVLEVVGASVAFDDLGGLVVLGVRRFGLSRSSRALKRTVDLVGALGALVVLGPLMLLAALAVRLDAPGPVLYRQLRVGRDGRHFHILKFRSMVDGAHALRASLADRNEAGDGLFKIDDDPRITRVGHLLRRTSLDELPQLLNVLRGEMSLVGPRPLVLDEDEAITGFDRRRLALTPGMTGPWQVAGSARVPMHEMLRMDYLYVASWSVWSDVQVLVRTVAHVLLRRGR